jgi:hypothetical protein
MDKVCTQWQSEPTYPKGIVCGSDEAQEWLLPWWWSRLRDHNDHRVVFCDFGMTEDALNWCRERGDVVKLPVSSKEAAHKGSFSSDFIEVWEKNYTDAVWNLRHAWFKKPLACLQSPFQRSIWLDLDCEVLGPLDDLFDLCSNESQVGIMREFAKSHHPRFHPEALYNSGVIVFEHGVPLIEKWACGAIELTDQFGGDDVLISHLINSLRIPVEEIPEIYNWRISQGINLNAVIWHWHRDGGKTFIRNFGGIKPALEQFNQIGRT